MNETRRDGSTGAGGQGGQISQLPIARNTLLLSASMAALFGIGLGWNFSFVAATAELVDLTSPVERGKILGFNDLLSGLLGAALPFSEGWSWRRSGSSASPGWFSRSCP